MYVPTKPALASWYGRQFSELSWHKTEGERIDWSPVILQSVIVHKTYGRDGGSALKNLPKKEEGKNSGAEGKHPFYDH